MAVTSDEIKYSNTTKIAGQSEEHAADVTLHPDGRRRLAVEAALSGTTSKYRVEWSLTKIELPASSVYTTFFSYTGSGILHGFHVDTDSDKSQIKLVIDGETIFQDFTCKQINDLGFKAAGAPPVLIQNRSGLSTINGSDLDFSPHVDILFNSGITIGIKKNDNNSVDVDAYIIYISEFT